MLAPPGPGVADRTGEKVPKLIAPTLESDAVLAVADHTSHRGDHGVTRRDSEFDLISNAERMRHPTCNAGSTRRQIEEQHQRGHFMRPDGSPGTTELDFDPHSISPIRLLGRPGQRGTGRGDGIRHGEHEAMMCQVDTGLAYRGSRFDHVRGDICTELQCHLIVDCGTAGRSSLITRRSSAFRAPPAGQHSVLEFGRAERAQCVMEVGPRVAQWSGRVLRCWAGWAALIAAAVGFDVVADGTGASADGWPDDQPLAHGGWPSPSSLTDMFVATLSAPLVMGTISGSILPKRLDATRFELPMPQPGDHLVTPPNVIVHSIRRAVVAVPLMAATICAVLAGLLSVTTDIIQGDSPSTLGATGGLLYGFVLGTVAALPGGTLLGSAAAFAIDAEYSYRRSIAVSIGAAVAIGFLPLLLLFDVAPDETPSHAVRAIGRIRGYVRLRRLVAREVAVSNVSGCLLSPRPDPLRRSGASCSRSHQCAWSRERTERSRTARTSRCGRVELGKPRPVRHCRSSCPQRWCSQSPRAIVRFDDAALTGRDGIRYEEGGSPTMNGQTRGDAPRAERTRSDVRFSDRFVPCRWTVIA